MNQSTINAFHQHLDECDRCREEPFNLCAKGYELLKAAAEGAGGMMFANATARAAGENGER